MKTKAFDCAEMKNRIQAEMLSDYEAHQDKYPSFVEFVKAKAEESEWIQRMKHKDRATRADAMP